MKIGGIIDISTKDIPSRVAIVFFTIGCNFNCEFCHNKHLLRDNNGKNYELNELISIIKSNQLISSVSITGGEPSLQNDLVALCREIKKLNLYISIDTNGSLPDKIKKLLPYVDRFALDIKSSLVLNRLESVTKSYIDPQTIVKSFQLINQENEIDFEVRTTYVENLLKPEDIEDILKFLIKNEFRGNFVLQQYQYSENVGEDYKKKFSSPSHITLLNLLEHYREINLPFEIYIRDEKVGYQKFRELLNRTV